MKEMILQYLHTCSVHDFQKIAKKYSITCSEKDLQNLYVFVQNHANELLDGDELCFQILKKQIQPDLYEKLYSYYQILKEKYL